MKKYVITWILSMVLFYLLIAFVTLEIDFRLWSGLLRFGLAVFGSLLAMSLSDLIIHLNKNK